jgi:hypothetical protein
VKFRDLPRVARWAVYLLLPGIIIHELAHVVVAYLVGLDVRVDWSVPVVRFDVEAETTAPEFLSVMLAPVPVAVGACALFYVATPDVTAATFAWAVFNLAAVGNVIEDVRLLLARAGPARAR